MHQALSVAEILAHIFSFLTNENLIHCAIVNKSWHAAANAYIWRSLSLDDFRTTVPQASFQGNAHHVTELRIKTANQIVSYGLHCNNLCDLSLPNDLRPEVHGDYLVQLLQKNKATLQTLKLGMRSIRPPLILRAIDGMSSLNKIEFDIRFPLESLAEFVYQVLYASPQLEHLIIACVGDRSTHGGGETSVADRDFASRFLPNYLPLSDFYTCCPASSSTYSTSPGSPGTSSSSSSSTPYFPSSPSSPSSSTCSSFPLFSCRASSTMPSPSTLTEKATSWRLRELAITFPQSQKAFDFYIPLLLQCPDLVHIRIPPLPVSMLPDLHRILRRAGHDSCLNHDSMATRATVLASYRPIEVLDLSGPVTYKDAEFAGIINACPPNTLKEIDLHQRIVGRQTAQAILQHCDSLVKLNMLNIQGTLDSIWIQTILASCTQLRCVKVRSMQPDVVYLHVDHILEGLLNGKSWACKQLQVMQIPIGGLCLPSKSTAALSSKAFPKSATSPTTTIAMFESPDTLYGIIGEDASNDHQEWSCCQSQDHEAICVTKHAEVFEQISKLHNLKLLNVTRGLFRGPTIPD